MPVTTQSPSAVLRRSAAVASIAVAAAFGLTACGNLLGDAGVEIDQDGVRVDDGSGNSVDVDQNGVEVDSEDGTTVDVDENGVDIDSEDGTTVDVDENGTQIDNGDGTCVTVDSSGNTQVDPNC